MLSSGRGWRWAAEGPVASTSLSGDLGRSSRAPLGRHSAPSLLRLARWLGGRRRVSQQFQPNPLPGLPGPAGPPGTPQASALPVPQTPRTATLVTLLPPRSVPFLAPGPGTAVPPPGLLPLRPRPVSVPARPPGRLPCDSSRPSFTRGPRGINESFSWTGHCGRLPSLGGSSTRQRLGFPRSALPQSPGDSVPGSQQGLGAARRRADGVPGLRVTAPLGAAATRRGFPEQRAPQLPSGIAGVPGLLPQRF